MSIFLNHVYSPGRERGRRPCQRGGGVWDISRPHSAGCGCGRRDCLPSPLRPKGRRANGKSRRSPGVKINPNAVTPDQCRRTQRYLAPAAVRRPAPVAQTSGTTPKMKASGPFNQESGAARQPARLSNDCSPSVRGPWVLELLGELDDQDRILLAARTKSARLKTTLG